MVLLYLILVPCALLMRPVQAQAQTQTVQEDSLAVENGEAENRPVPLWPRIRRFSSHPQRRPLRRCHSALLTL